jgi:hypothetical protein
VAVELDALPAEEDLAVDRARDLVPGGPHERVGLAVGLPLEIEAHRHLVAPTAAWPVELGGVVDADPRGLVGDLPAVERVRADVLGPEPVAPDLERRGLRQRHLLVDDGHRLAPRTAHDGVVPAGVEVGVEADPDPPPDGAVGRAEVEVPGLAPQRLGPGLVPTLVGSLDDRAIGTGGHAG